MKRLKILAVLFLVFVALSFFPAPGHASTTFMNRTDWITAVGAYQDVNIDYLLADPGEYGTFAAGTGITIPYLNNSLSFDNDLIVAKVPDSWSTWSDGNEPTVLYTDGLSSVTGTFGSAMSAFGLEIEPYAFNDVGYLITLTLSDGTSLSQSVLGEYGAAFFGWNGGLATSVTNFTITSPDESGGFAFGRMVAPVPLPPSVLLLGSGLLGFFGLRRRFQNQH